jgi:iron complex outermembrane recepter protein
VADTGFKKSSKGGILMKRPGLLSTSALCPALFLAATFGAPAPAFAQAQSSSQTAKADNEEVIIITGTRIPRAGFDTPQPASVLSGDQIDLRGYTNLGDALNELPVFGVPDNSTVGAQAGAFGAGQTFVNLYGLGSQRTLTTVNGRRFVSSNSASIFGPTGAGGDQVDFNVLPTLLVDRVEVLSVGGAPIYGSDAIAGTVNVITKQHFQGLQLDAQQGVSQRGDAYQYRLGFLGGQNFAGDRGNVTVAFEYNHENGLSGTDRRHSGLGRFFTDCADPASPFAQCLIQDRTLPSLSETGIPTLYDFIVLSPAQAAGFGGFQPGIVDSQGRPLMFDPQGSLIPIDFGQATGNLLNFNGGNGFRLPENLLAETRRILGVGTAEYHLNDSLRVFGEAWYANSRGRQLRDQPVYNTYLFGPAGSTDGQLVLSINNPFLRPEARAIIAQNLATSPFAVDPTHFFLTRANTDIIPSDGYAQVELYRFVAGLDGKFSAFGRDIQFEIVSNYGHSKTKGHERVLVQQNFENALNAVRDASGNIVCAPGYVNAPIATISSTCAPLNPFGQQISQAAIDYVTTFADPTAINKQWVLTADVKGSLFDLPGGTADFVLGFEHRNESADFDPGAFYFGQINPANPTGDRLQFGRSIPIDPVHGKFHTNEFFAELKLPIIGPEQDIPMVNSLDLNGAARYIKHSLAGGDWAYTAGAEYRPVKDITLRGNYTRSVRSPSVTELFNPTSQIFTTADDPCDARFINAGPNPSNRAANCASAGITQPFASSIVDFTSRGTVSGNPNLANEVANSWTVGTILRPRFLPRFTLAVDWISIKLNGAITNLDADAVLKACYDAPSYPTPICSNITRDANHQVVFIATGYANASSRTFRGLTADMEWRMPTPFLGADSSVNLGVNYLYTAKSEFRVGEGDLTTLRNSIGYSKHQATGNITYRNHGFTGQVQVEWIGPAVFDPDEPANNRDIPGVGGVAFVNTTLQYELDNRITLRFNVDNIFDQNPPYPSPGGGGRVTYFSGILGRYFSIGARLKLR